MSGESTGARSQQLLREYGFSLSDTAKFVCTFFGVAVCLVLARAPEAVVDTASIVSSFILGYRLRQRRVAAAREQILGIAGSAGARDTADLLTLHCVPDVDLSETIEKALIRVLPDLTQVEFRSLSEPQRKSMRTLVRMSASANKVAFTIALMNALATVGDHDGARDIEYVARREEEPRMRKAASAALAKLRAQDADPASRLLRPADDPGASSNLLTPVQPTVETEGLVRPSASSADAADAREGQQDE